MSKVIYMNVNGSYGGGGPTVWAARMRDILKSKGHKVIFDYPAKANIALCIIESGKVLKQVGKNTKVIVRLDGAYYKKYWHSKTPDRMWRADMTALHSAITRDVEKVDCMVYQSQFSKKMIDSEISERKDKFKIINNGVDLNLFKPNSNICKKDEYLKIGHVGMMRNGYMMESLLGVYNNIKNQIKCKLFLYGKMDEECQKIFKDKKDDGVCYFGQVNNVGLPEKYNCLDIFLAPRMGSSCDNVVIESQACGIPVIIPSFGGNVELVKNGESGIVVESGQWDYDDKYVQNISNAVLEINKNLGGFKIRARQYAVKELSIEKMVDKYMEAMK